VAPGTIILLIFLPPPHPPPHTHTRPLQKRPFKQFPSISLSTSLALSQRLKKPLSLVRLSCLRSIVYPLINYDELLYIHGIPAAFFQRVIYSTCIFFLLSSRPTTCIFAAILQLLCCTVCCNGWAVYIPESK
jgi:hypothetical protein